MAKKNTLAAVFCAAVFAGGSVSAALAGEVKGPPNQVNNTNETGALDHANSACAASGLNDFDLSDPMGQLASQVQTAADSWKFYGLPKGSPGARLVSAMVGPAKDSQRVRVGPDPPCSGANRSLGLSFSLRTPCK